MDDKAVQVLCNPDDNNLDVIATRTSALVQAAQNNTLVAIACNNPEKGEDVILLAVMTKDGGEEYIQYAPIGELYYPGDVSYERLTPPEMAITAEDEESDVKH